MSGLASGKIIKILIFLFIIYFCMFFFISPAYGQEVDYPDYSGYVNDFAGLLDDASRYDLESLISGIEKNTGAEIAVVTINTLEGITIEEYAAVLFEKWGIGKADEDNGLLILVALTERKVRIEVGYGLEGIVTDLEAGRIIDGIITPNFKNEDYNRGIYDAVVTVSNQIYGEQELEIMAGEDLEEYSSSDGDSSFFSGIPSGCICCFPVFIIIFLIIFLVNLFRRRCPKCRRFWALTIRKKILEAASYTSSGNKQVERTCKYCSFHDKKIVRIPKKTRSSGFSSGGGSFGGGSSGGSFGGGSSGGGGASGSW